MADDALSGRPPRLLRFVPVVVGLVGFAIFMYARITDAHLAFFIVAVGLVLVSMGMAAVARHRAAKTGWARSNVFDTPDEPDPDIVEPDHGGSPYLRGRRIDVKRTDPAWVWFAAPIPGAIFGLFITLSDPSRNVGFGGVPFAFFIVSPMVGLELGLLIGWFAQPRDAASTSRFSPLQWLAIVAGAIEAVPWLFSELVHLLGGERLNIPPAAYAWGILVYFILQVAALGAHVGARLRKARSLPATPQQETHIRNQRRRNSVFAVAGILVVSLVAAGAAFSGIGRGADGASSWNSVETFERELGNGEASYDFPADPLAFVRSRTATTDEMTAPAGATRGHINVTAGSIERVEANVNGSWITLDTFADDTADGLIDDERLDGASIRIVMSMQANINAESGTATVRFTAYETVRCSYEGEQPLPPPEHPCLEPDPSWKTRSPTED